MGNLRLIQLTTPSSTQIVCKFSADLNPEIGIANIQIAPQSTTVPVPTVLFASISGPTLTLTVQPLTPLGVYTVTFVSTSTTRFSDINATQFLIEDGRNNSTLVLGPDDPANPVFTNFTNYLRNNIYNLEPGSVIYNYLQTAAFFLSQAYYSILQMGNENYLTKSIVDEVHTRGTGPYDRLGQEGTYEVLRVAPNPTGYTANNAITISDFDTSLVSLRQISIVDERLEAGSTDQVGTFNTNDLILTVQNPNVIVLTSLTFFYNGLLPNGSTFYQYNLAGLGYQVLDARYDTQDASPYATLASNQFRLNDIVLTDANFSITNIAYIVANYEYKNLGRNVNPVSVTVTKVIPSVREVVPSIENIFNLKNSPIVDQNGNALTLKGVQFLDPNANPALSAVHPAFKTELQFSFQELPSNPGEYSVDYTTGTVYVYGADRSNNGTGPFPPLATYNYLYTFQPLIDYVYATDTADLVALPTSQLIGTGANIAFAFEDVFVPNIDYVADVHVEVLAENINNQIIPNLNALRVQNSPVTDVFRIFNETQGQAYTVTRWENDLVFFTFPSPPDIPTQTEERAAFQQILNETLFINQTINNGQTIFQIDLQNNNIISATEDCIGSSVNTSLVPSMSSVFQREVYFDADDTQVNNLVRLTAVGQYMVDYVDGVIYVAVTTDQSQDIGTVSYRGPEIIPQFPHVIAPLNIYYKISMSQPANETFTYTSFTDGSILPSTFDLSDEKILNNNPLFPYFLVGGAVGVFMNAVFTPGISSSVGAMRSAFEFNDLLFNPSPINFASATTFLDHSVNMSPLVVSSLQVVNKVGSQYFLNTGFDLTYLSPNISLTFTLTRLSDNAVLGYSSYAIGNPIVLTLAGTGSPQNGDNVIVTVTATITSGSRVVLDYDKGGYYLDYTYLADQIIVDYEYGDNYLDFRNSASISAGDQYYVTYKVGALRDALLKNFGTLINIPLLSVFDDTFDRENYRNCLIAAMGSLPKGPTIGAMTNMVQTITQVPPQIEESIFELWSLGSAFLYPEPPQVNNNPQVLPAKYDNGLLLQGPGQNVVVPTCSRISIDEGTFSSWILPQWNGIDNDSELTFIIRANGAFVNESRVFIGAGEVHPVYKTDTLGNQFFTVSKRGPISPLGKPNKHKEGVFIYLCPDGYGSYNRWYVDVVNDTDLAYSITMTTDGELFDAKYMYPSDGYASITSAGNRAVFNDTSVHQGFCFVADYFHYLLDVGDVPDRNRISIYKDPAGYLNFRVIDNNRAQYQVSADVSNWISNQPHFVATSWTLNSQSSQDEIHLFIDGLEVPNLIRYGTKIPINFGQRFRTPNPEEIVSVITRPITAGDDMVTIAGSAIVTAGQSFDAAGIEVNDKLYIQEIGFDTYYTITNVNGNQLTLSASMPLSLTSVNYSVNQLTIDVKTRIDLYKNIAVTVLRSGVETEIPGPRALFPYYEITESDGYNQIILSNGAEAGDTLLIKPLGLNFKYVTQRYYAWGNCQNFLQTVLPPPVSLSDVKITKFLMTETAVYPSQSVNDGYYLWTATNFDGYTSCSNVGRGDPGRKLSVRLAGTNVTFPVTVTIDGLTSTGYESVPLTFTGEETLDTGTMFLCVSSITAEYNPINLNQNAFVLTVFETDYLTVSESSPNYPVIQYSYQVFWGNTPEGTIGQTTFTDTNALFTPIDVGNYIHIFPGMNAGAAAGYYKIVSVQDNNNLTVATPFPATFLGTKASPPAYPNAIPYEILNTTTVRNGLQNGTFFFENAPTPGQPYLLTQGTYQFTYATYLAAKFDPLMKSTYIGSDLSGSHQINAIVDQVRIDSIMLSDTRVGEAVNPMTGSVTQLFNSINPPPISKNTLTLLTMNDATAANSAPFYINADRSLLQYGSSVNPNFGQSVILDKQPMTVDNLGLLNTRTPGSIEFWANPFIDTYNDPVYRFYFDASGIITEQVSSTNRATVQVAGLIGTVVSVTLQYGNQSYNYYGGQGSVSSDLQTINLSDPLPNEQTPVIVTYIPNGLKGDRLSIYKDPYGYLTFDIRGAGNDYQVRTPIFWQAGTWHRVKATWTVNSGGTNDQIHLFVDGFEHGNVLYGQGLLFGQNIVFGQSFVGQSAIFTSIKTTDQVNQFNIGSDYNGKNIGNCLIDNLRISDIMRQPFIAFGVPIDVNYNANVAATFPVTTDLYTTYLLDFNTVQKLNTNYALLKNENFGIFDFSINIIDSFGIVSGSKDVQSVLETLINTLKPAVSRATITYEEP
jgi:hypothetical protein